MIGYYANTREKPRASENKKIRDRVDSESKYGRWKLRIMGTVSRRFRNLTGPESCSVIFQDGIFKMFKDSTIKILA